MSVTSGLRHLHYLRHVPYAGLGFVGEWALARGVQVDETRMYDGEDPPDPATLEQLVVLGGPMGVCSDASPPAWLQRELDYVGEAVRVGTRVLGICLGAQMLARVLGAAVRRNDHPEIGWHRLELVGDDDALLRPFAQPDVRVMQWHSDTFALPAGAVQLARTEGCEQQAFRHGDNVLALQFHPEFTLAVAETAARRDGETAGGPFAQPLDEILVPARFDRLREATFAFCDRYAATV